MFPSVCNPITLIENNNLPYGIDLDCMVERDNTSYFSESLQFILECQREYHDANKAFYRSIVESVDSEAVIHESFGAFFSKIKEIIDKVLKFIKNLFERFVTGLNRFVKSEKYLKKHSTDFSKFTSANEFEHSGYVFTFANEIPYTEALAAFSMGFIFANDHDNNDVAVPSADGLKGTLGSLTSSLENGEWYDAFRAGVIGKDGVIFKTDFNDELFSVYRNGESSPEDMTITNQAVSLAYARFDGAHKAIDSAKRTKSRIESEYNSIKKQIEKIVAVNYAGGTKSMSIANPGDNTKSAVSTDDITNMDLLIKAKTAQVQEMSVIHTLAFAAKLDALNDCFKQDKTILYKALVKIQGSVGKEN